MIRPIYATLLLCVLTMHTVTHSLVIPGLEFSQFQTTISEHLDGTDSLTSADGNELRSDGDYKPPKHSFTDYSTFLSPNYLRFSYAPTVSTLKPHERQQAPPEVFLEIDVPPDHA